VGGSGSAGAGGSGSGLVVVASAHRARYEASKGQREALGKALEMARGGTPLRKVVQFLVDRGVLHWTPAEVSAAAAALLPPPLASY
jgi:hypothetical protein